MEAVIILVFLLIFIMGIEFFLLYLHNILDIKLKKAIPMHKDYDDNLKFIMTLMESTIIWIIVLTAIPLLTILVGIIFK